MDSRTPTYVFNFLAGTGLFLLLATVVAAAVSPTIHRSHTWFSMIISWMVYAASYMLILGHQLGPEPPQGICAFQMTLIYASRTSPAGMPVYLKLTRALFTNQADHKYTQLLLFVPWALFAGVSAEALIAVRDFTEIQRDPNHMYCHSLLNIQTRISAIICVIGLGAALSLEIWTSVILYRNWMLFRHLTTTSNDLRLSSLIRLLVFTVQTSTGLGLGALEAEHNVRHGLAIWSALLPILPVLCGLVFGSQKDITHCFMFWKPVDNDPSPSSHTCQDEEV
ncbi:hypothetical protein B0H11DRAFT_2142246 [Mycena galericulata]|nr:hypothetical protein B0H11DRAFT_2142246 [Mycena galericulata]